MIDLSISIVLFKPDLTALVSTVSSLCVAVKRMQPMSCSVTLIDNTPKPVDPAVSDLARAHGFALISGHGNVGFGAGHNLCLPAAGHYHLILNPDVVLPPDGLETAVAFMETHPEFGLLAPMAIWPDGEIQPLCKRYPSMLDLLLRGFAPAWIRAIYSDRLIRYEFRDVETDEQGAIPDPPMISGCFMLFRSEILNALGGFDPRYFMYFEDFDLSIRAAESSRTVMLPALTIVHAGGRTSRKGTRHLLHFTRSAIQFFNKHGWRLI